MNKNQIEKLMKESLLPETSMDSKLIETHTSWVILTDHFAFKIKRPVKYSFLDYSDLSKRKHYCMRELELNRRLAPDIYYDVVPVYEEAGGKGKKQKNGVIDYAVKMKRMDNSKALDKMLEKKAVSDSDIKRLAVKIASFHRNAKIIKDPFNTMGFQEKYEDILSQAGFIRDNFGEGWLNSIKKSVEQSNVYLNTNRDYLNQRILDDFIRDCHGDLKAANIILYEDPIIFDRVEFNDELRHMDILNDIAFLCVDLDHHNYFKMSKLFFNSYLREFGTEDSDVARSLFSYYKSYCANFKAKVAMISYSDQKDKKNALQHIELDLKLLEHYSTGF